MDKLHVLIITSFSARKKLLRKAVEMTGLGEVASTSSNISLALEYLDRHVVDVILLPALEPEARAADFLSAFTREYSGPYAIVFGKAADRVSREVVRCQAMGALDYISLPIEREDASAVRHLANQLRGLFTEVMTAKFTSRPSGAMPRLANGSSSKEVAAKREHWQGADLVVIASSTGGPVALETICRNLPADFNKPILLVQHIAAEFTQSLAQSLDKRCPLAVSEASDGDLVRPGQVFVAPGGIHSIVDRKGFQKLIRLEKSPPVNGLRPAADVLFRSVARVYRDQRVLAIILTGMGNDGLAGVREMKKSCDCYCLVQSEKTCVVPGMPKSIKDAGLADREEDLDTIAAYISNLAGTR